MLGQVLVKLKEGDTISINIANTIFTEVIVKKVLYARKDQREGTIFEVTCADLESGQAYATVTIYA